MNGYYVTLPTRYMQVYNSEGFYLHEGNFEFSFQMFLKSSKYRKQSKVYLHTSLLTLVYLFILLPNILTILTVVILY